MEQASLVSSAVKAIFFDNDIENGRHPEIFRGILPSRDLEIAFAVAEAHFGIDLDLSLDLAESSLAPRTLSSTCELVEAAKAVNSLRRSKGIESLIPDHVLGYLKGMIRTYAGHKRKYDERLDQTEQQARQRAAAKRVNDMFGREERARRRDGLKELESQLYTNNQELVTAQSLLLKERRAVKILERSLECQICPVEAWDTATGCGHLFGAGCIQQWLETNSGWEKDGDGIWVSHTPRCPICREAMSERDLRRIYL